MDDALGFLKQKVSSGLSDVENWASDAGNDVTHALGAVFGTNNSSPQAPTQQQSVAPRQAPPQQNTQLGSLPINNPLSTQQQSQPQQNPTLKLNFGQNQAQTQPPPQNTPTQLNTSLVNFTNPTTSIKTTNLPGSFNATPQQPSNNSDPFGKFMQGTVNAVKSLPSAAIDTGTSAAQLALGDPTAALRSANAAQRAQQTVTKTLQGFGTPLVEAGLSLSPNQRTYQPTGRLATDVFGSNPIQNVEKNVASNFNQNKGPLAERLFGAAADTAGQAVKIGSTILPVAKGFGDVADVARGDSPAFSPNTIKIASNLSSKLSDPDIAKATDQIKQTGTKIVQPLAPEQESLNATESRATAPKEVDTLPSSYNLRKGIGVTPDMITDADRQEASYTRSTPEFVAGQRMVRERNLDAESKAQEVLTNGGTRKEAVQAYQGANPGITTKDATFRVSRVARESDVALRPNERSVNPEGDQHTLPTAKPGDYERAEINKSIVENSTDSLLKKANQSLTDLSQPDRDNFEDYLEKTKPLEEADDADKVQQAINDSLKLTDTGNALDHQVGGQTPHIENYFPGYTMRDDPEQIARDQAQAAQDTEEDLGPETWQKMSQDERREAVAQRMATKEITPSDDENFGGYKNQKREFANRAERKAAKVNDEYDDPRDALTRYANGLKFKIGNDAFVKATQEADLDNRLTKTPSNTIDLGGGKGVKVSDQGYKALKNNDIKANKGNALVKVNRLTKQANIALGVPHAVIIPPRFIGALSEIKANTAARGGLQAVSEDATDLTKVDTEKPTDPEVSEFGARVGSPLHSDRINAGVSDTKVGAKYNPLTVPKRIVYNWLLPTLHSTLLRALKENLDSRNIDYDSPEARSYGKQINDVMGYSKNGTGLFDQSTFAPSLIKSTANLYAKSVTKDGSIARGGVAGQQLVNQALGFISKAVSNQISQSQGKPQNKSKDDFWSTVLKETVSPSLYTPFRKGASKGNAGEQIDLGIPGQYQSDAIKVALGLNRKKNGQLGVSLNNPAQALTNIAQTGKDIASPVLSAALSGVTNQTYSGQQIRNPNASPLTQLEQTVANSGAGALPINLQTPADEGLSKILPPKFQQDIPQNQTGSTGLRVAAQTFGLNPKADITTGQGPAEQLYYATKDKLLAAVAGSPEATDAVNAYLDKDVNNKGQKVDHSPEESIGVANLVAGDTQALAALKTFEQAQPNHDPMWNLSNKDLGTFLSYQGTRATDPTKQAMPIADTGFNNGQGLSGFIKERDAYYNNSPKYPSTSIVNPATPTYPTFQGQQGTDYSAYENTIKNGTSAQKSAFLNAHPDVVDAMSQINQYYNKLGVAQGGLAIKNAPNLTAAQQSALDYYDSLPKSKTAGNTDTATSGERSAWIKANPTLWNQITQILAGDTLQATAQLGATQQYQGVPYTSKYLGDISSLGQDIANTNGVYSLNPGLAYSQGSSGYSSGSGSSSSSSSPPFVPLPKIKHFKTPKQKKPPKLKGFRAPHIKKAGRINIQANGQLKPVQVARPVSVVKLATK